jgi:hypothetical protein
VLRAPDRSSAHPFDLVPQVIQDNGLVTAREEVCAVTDHPAIEGIAQHLTDPQLRPRCASHVADAGCVQLSRDRRL